MFADKGARRVDNLAHTLVGAALGQAGLKRRSGLAMATLMIAANLPDLDVIGLPFGHNLAWRRGWTHGPLAFAVLPVLLAGAMLWWDRRQAARGTRPANRAQVRFGALLALALIGQASHLLLDLFNTYGVRLLMPFSGRWFYGDALFIIDPWLWSALALGVWASRRRGVRWPAATALVAVFAYAGAMAAGSAAARRIAGPGRVVASPVPVNPFRREIVVDLGDRYRLGELRWTPAPVLTLGVPVPTRMDDPRIARAAERSRPLRDFLIWSRLPFAAVTEEQVTVGDARYNRTPSDGRFSVTAPVTRSR